MFRRRPGKSAVKEASAYSRRSAVADSAWIAQDRVRQGLDRPAFSIEKRVVWPLQDRVHALGAPARAVSFGLVVLLAAAAGVAGLVWAAPDRPDDGTGAPVATASAPAVEVEAVRAQKPAEPTLHGAAPVFRPSHKADASEVDPAKAVVKPAAVDTSSPSSPSSSATADAGAAASAAAASPAAKTDSASGRPAGPAAVAVARDFSDAFVVYETGGLDAKVRKAFGATATPELSRALLRRPPRLPAAMKVPQAKVLNVVPGPSDGGIYAVSVSLLRVGVTSELRLDMEKLKGKEWRVTNVLG
jgi:hypothetical protein